MEVGGRLLQGWAARCEDGSGPTGCTSPQARPCITGSSPSGKMFNPEVVGQGI